MISKIIVTNRPLIPLDAEIHRQTPPKVVKLLLRLLTEYQVLRGKNRMLREEIAKLRTRIEEMEAKLDKNSSNYSNSLHPAIFHLKKSDSAQKLKSPVNAKIPDYNVYVLHDWWNRSRKSFHAVAIQ